MEIRSLVVRHDDVPPGHAHQFREYHAPAFRIPNVVQVAKIDQRVECAGPERQSPLDIHTYAQQRCRRSRQSEESLDAHVGNDERTHRNGAQTRHEPPVTRRDVEDAWQCSHATKDRTDDPPFEPIDQPLAAAIALTEARVNVATRLPARRRQR